MRMPAFFSSTSASAARTSFCKLTNVASTSSSGNRRRRPIERSRSRTCFGLPAQASPILGRRFARADRPNLAKPAPAHADRMTRRNLSSLVLKAKGRLGRGHWKSNRKGAALGHDSRRAGKTGQKLLQRRLDLDNNACPARGDQRGIAAELNRVTKPLLAMKQDRLAGDIIRSEPERLRKIAGG